MLWIPPEGMDTMALNHWFGLTYMCFFFAETFTSIPYYALGAELTDSYQERNSVYFWQNGFGQVGTLVGMMLPAGIIIMTEDERLAYTVMAIMFATVHATGMLGILLVLKERPLDPNTVAAPFVAIFRYRLNSIVTVSLWLSLSPCLSLFLYPDHIFPSFCFLASANLPLPVMHTQPGPAEPSLSPTSLLVDPRLVRARPAERHDAALGAVCARPADWQRSQ